MRPDVIPQLSDAEEVLAGGPAPRRRRLLGADPERARAGAGAGAARPLRRDQRLPLRLGDPQPQERQPLDRGVADGLERTLAARARGGAALRGRDRDLLRLPLRGRGAAGARLRDRRAAGGGRLRGGRLRRHDRDGQPAPGRRVLRRRARAPRRGRADRPLPQHPRPGPRQRAGGAGAGRRLLRVELRRARRLPGAARLDRQRRHRGRGLDAARDGGRDRDRPAGAWSRPRAPRRRCSAARSARTCCGPARSTGTARQRPNRLRDRDRLRQGPRGRPRRRPAAPPREDRRAGQAAGARAGRAARRPRLLRRGGGAGQLERGGARRRRRRHRPGHDRRPPRRPDGQRPDGQGRLLGAEDGREDPPHPGAGALACRCRWSTWSTRPGRGSPTRCRCSPAAAAPGGSSTTRCGSPARCRRSACCSGRAPPAAPTSRPSATS